MKRVSVGVVGVGSLGQHHARIYAELEGTDLFGVVDIDEGRARSVGGRLGCQSWTNHQHLLDNVEAISLAVPTESHAEIGVEFLRRGCHVLVEKPIASTLAEADRMIEAATASGGLLRVGHTERFNPVFTAVRPYITTPRFFEAHRLGVFVPRSLDIDVVLDLMIHDLDLVLNLVGEKVAEIRAVGVPILTPRVDIANARLEFEDGCVANITSSRVSKDKVRKLRLFQPNDYISIDFHQQSVEMYSLTHGEGLPRIEERQPEVVAGEPLRFELESFLQEIRGEAVSLNCSGPQGRRALDLALQVLNQVRRI